MGRRAVLCLLVGASFLSLGPQCGSVLPEQSLVGLWPDTLEIAEGSQFQLELSARLLGPLQAFEVEVTWDPSILRLDAVLPHSGFDDDGGLFVPPQIDSTAGVARRLVDLRHGAPADADVAGLAWLQWTAVGPGSASVSVSKVALASDQAAPILAVGLPSDVAVLP